MHVCILGASLKGYSVIVIGHLDMAPLSKVGFWDFHDTFQHLVSLLHRYCQLLSCWIMCHLLMLILGILRIWWHGNCTRIALPITQLPANNTTHIRNLNRHMYHSENTKKRKVVSAMHVIVFIFIKPFLASEYTDCPNVLALVTNRVHVAVQHHYDEMPHASFG